jgi:hypothetical protein
VIEKLIPYVNTVNKVLTTRKSSETPISMIMSILKKTEAPQNEEDIDVEMH